MKPITKISLVVVLLLISNICVAASQLLVAPTRIVFSEKMRSAQVTLVNTGDEAGTYRISFVNKRMTPEGNFEDVKEPQPGEQFSDKMIRFSPRQVTLAPGQSQVVRLGLRKPADLDAGEYRSHMLFKAVPKDVGKDIAKQAKTEGITIQIKAIVAISIPIIVRHGKTDVKTSIVSASYQPRKEKEDYSHLVIDLERTGNQSVYGDFLAEFVDKEGKRTVIAQIKGVAIYTPNKGRKVKLALNMTPGVDLVDGTIQIFYRSPVDAGGKVLAQSQIKIP